MSSRGLLARLSGFLGWGPAATVRAVLATYDAAGGALLAGGLAYSALFAIVPLAVLLAGIAGLVVADQADRAAVVDAIANVLPPLRDLIRLVLDEAAGAAGAVSLLGGAALIWSASRFVVAFEDALGRVFRGTRRRGFAARNIGAVAAVLGLIGAIVLGAVVSGLASFLDAARAAGEPIVSIPEGAGWTLLPLAAGGLSIALIYRLVPVAAPRWRAILPPALVVTVVLDVLGRAFVFIAPRLIGAAATIGALATAFAALAWLGLSFQAILLGAAWARQRDEAGALPDPAPAMPGG